MLLRTILDQNRELSGKLERLNDKVDTVKEAVVKIQAIDINKKFEEIERRLTAIEAIEQKRSGAFGFAKGLKDAFPLILALGSAVGTFFLWLFGQRH